MTTTERTLDGRVALVTGGSRGLSAGARQIGRAHV